MSGNSEQVLRAVSDSLLQDLDRLVTLEEEKRTLKPEDPRVNAIAQEVAEIAGRILSKSVTQERITRTALEAAESGQFSGPTHSIDETPRSMQVILEDWRAAERRAASATTDTPDHAIASKESELLRQEYQARYAERQHDPARN